MIPRKLRPILWQQGQFLTQHSLQQQDAFHQSNLSLRIEKLHPFMWGVEHIQLRHDSLVNNTIDIEKLCIVTPSGMEIHFGDELQNAMIKPRSFEGLLDPSKGELGVYLVIQKYSPGRKSVTSNTDSEQPTGQLLPPFHCMQDTVGDMYEPEAESEECAFQYYNLNIMFDTDHTLTTSKGSFEAIKIGQLGLDAKQGQPSFVEHYIAPCVSMHGSDTLMTIAKAVRDLLSGKAQNFMSFVRQRGVRASSSGTQDLLRLHILQTLHRYIPLLQHHIEIGSMHPMELYELFRLMIGELSVFSEKYDVFGAKMSADGQNNAPLPEYDHEELFMCFSAAQSALRELVLDLTTGPEQGIKLVYDGSEYYKADLSGEFFTGDRPRYYLMIDSSITGNDLVTRLQTTGKISAFEEMPLLRSSSVVGLKLVYLPIPPEELPQKSGRYSYFAIDINAPQWKGIEQHKNIAIFTDLDPEDTMMKIIKIDA